MYFVTIENNPIAGNAKNFHKNVLVTNWSQKRSATEGFKLAQFDLILGLGEIEEFFRIGLGRMVTRYSADGNTIIWQGFINSMTLTQPGMQSQGSLSNMYNGVTVRYTQLDTVSNPPDETEQQQTAQVTDTNSRIRYGVKDIIYKPPTEKLTSAMADQLISTFLEQYRIPRRSANVAPANAKVRLYVECLGYKDTLNWQVYTQTILSSTQDASAQVTDLMDSSDLFIESSLIAENTTPVQRYYNDDKTILELLNNVTSLGDSNNDRWLAYVTGGRVLVYERASTVIKYYRRMSDPEQAIYDALGRKVPNWEVEPNTWIVTIDAHPFGLPTNDLINNQQAMYIESVSWNEQDDKVSLTGSRGDELTTLVARVAHFGEVLL